LATAAPPPDGDVFNGALAPLEAAAEEGFGCTTAAETGGNGALPPTWAAAAGAGEGADDASNFALMSLTFDIEGVASTCQRLWNSEKIRSAMITVVRCDNQVMLYSEDTTPLKSVGYMYNQLWATAVVATALQQQQQRRKRRRRQQQHTRTAACVACVRDAK
jgi:hypothetical protein